ncbi:MAG: hypothetical protein ABW047_07395 [Nitrospiraceae bacterium]
MVMTDETFIASMLFGMSLVRMYQKLGVNHIDQQPQQPTPGPALSEHQKQPLDEAA